MNNFRNQYVGPDTYQGKVHEYYKNPLTPNSIQFSLNNHQGFEQNETRHSQKYEKTKNHSIYLNDQLGKRTDSKPVLFSPPKVDSVQKPLNENSKEGLPLVTSESKNREKDKEEVVSNLTKEFSLMLDDTSSKNEEFTALPESEFENDSFLNSSESLSISEKKYADEYSSNEDDKNSTEHNDLTIGDHYTNMLFDEFESGRKKHSLNENTSILEDMFSKILSESDELQEEKQKKESHEEMRNMIEEYVGTNNDKTEDNFFALFSKIDEFREEDQDSTKTEADVEKLDGNNDTFTDKFYTMLLENDELQEEQDGNIIAEEIDGANENTDTLADKFYTILSENDELQKEKQNSSITNVEEAKYVEIEDISTDEPQLNQKKNSSKKKNRKYCINKNNPYHIADFKEDDGEQLLQKNTYFNDSIENTKKITVKMPVLLTELQTDIDIIETIDLLMPLQNILKVEWSVQSLDCNVVLPSTTVFLKGEITAETKSMKTISNH